MSTERLIEILEDIRDQQKRQLDNFERALSAQADAAEIQRRGRRTLLILGVMPWVLALSLFVVLLSGWLLD